MVPASFISTKKSLSTFIKLRANINSLRKKKGSIMFEEQFKLTALIEMKVFYKSTK